MRLYTGHFNASSAPLTRTKPFELHPPPSLPSTIMLHFRRVQEVRWVTKKPCHVLSLVETASSFPIMVDSDVSRIEARIRLCCPHPLDLKSDGREDGYILDSFLLFVCAGCRSPSCTPYCYSRVLRCGTWMNDVVVRSGEDHLNGGAWRRQKLPHQAIL